MNEETEERMFDAMVELIVRVKVLDIQAPTYEEAARRAADGVLELTRDMFEHVPTDGGVAYGESAAEVRDIRVDDQQDLQHEHSQWFNQMGRQNI